MGMSGSPVPDTVRRQQPDHASDLPGSCRHLHRLRLETYLYRLRPRSRNRWPTRQVAAIRNRTLSSGTVVEPLRTGGFSSNCGSVPEPRICGESPVDQHARADHCTRNSASHGVEDGVGAEQPVGQCPSHGEGRCAGNEMCVEDEPFSARVACENARRLKHRAPRSCAIEGAAWASPPRSPGSYSNWQICICRLPKGGKP